MATGSRLFSYHAQKTQVPQNVWVFIRAGWSEGNMIHVGFVLEASSGLLLLCVYILLDDENVISYSQRGVGRCLAAHCLHLIIC